MADAETVSSSSHPEWDAFAARHFGMPSLALDPLYSLSEELINAILDTAPQFFTADQVAFERDLARTADIGFFLHSPLGSSHETATALEKRQTDSANAIRDLLAEELRGRGADAEDCRAFAENDGDQAERTRSRQAAYAGWLVLNATYHAELRGFRERWEGTVRLAGRFPRLPTWFGADPLDRRGLSPAFLTDSYQFFARWGLDTLLTWDWPVPMEPDLNVGLRQNMDLLSPAGAVLFLPWYLLRGGVLDLKAVIDNCRLASPPEHLHGWVNKRGDRLEGVGDVRYATLLLLYRFGELALRRRYADACAGNQHRLDLALASVIGRQCDTVKKLRHELRQTLEEAALI